MVRRPMERDFAAAMQNASASPGTTKVTDLKSSCDNNASTMAGTRNGGDDFISSLAT
jgi:hypothetical protein